MFFLSTARKESAKEKQLKEEEKILESVAEGRGKIIMQSNSNVELLMRFTLIYLQMLKQFLISLSALMSVKEMAKGIIYDDPIKTRYVLDQ